MKKQEVITKEESIRMEKELKKLAYKAWEDFTPDKNKAKLEVDAIFCLSKNRPSLIIIKDIMHVEIDGGKFKETSEGEKEACHYLLHENRLFDVIEKIIKFGRICEKFNKS